MPAGLYACWRLSARCAKADCATNLRLQPLAADFKGKLLVERARMGSCIQHAGPCQVPLHEVKPQVCFTGEEHGRITKHALEAQHVSRTDRHALSKPAFSSIKSPQ